MEVQMVFSDSSKSCLQKNFVKKEISLKIGFIYLNPKVSETEKHGIILFANVYLGGFACDGHRKGGIQDQLEG